ncbi:MAG TPA: diaminopimelate decarboxylase [Gammaproteobacteria bacterium]|nr:diaminopimelate decarboxylase [Gammaproteobacteria bacterium]
MWNELAQQYGTPCYVYDKKLIEKNWTAFFHTFESIPHQICYAVKANSNLAVLQVLAKLGSGFDIVSGGELARVLKAGGDPKKIVFSGVGKQDHEILSALKAGIGCFNVESQFELGQINQLAKSVGMVAPIALRINPDIPIKSHRYIATGLKENKFGIPIEEALFLYLYAKNLPHLSIVGIACHLGSQIQDAEPYLIALKKLLGLVDELAKKNIRITQCDIGGGYSVKYHDEQSFDLHKLGKVILPEFKNRNLKLLVEPGRAIVADSGVLLTKVISTKVQSGKNFVIVDAAMNDLIRPALYEAYHDIVPCNKRKGEEKEYDVVGPVCETGDFLGHHRKLCVEKNDLLMIMNTGAYGFVMSSNYNSRPRCAEVMVDGEKSYLVRARETLENLWENEICLPE